MHINFFFFLAAQGGGGLNPLNPPPRSATGFKKHYKTIEFYIKILLNIHNFQFCGALRRQNFMRFAEKFEIFLTYAPPPHPTPQSEKWILMVMVVGYTSTFAAF